MSKDQDHRIVADSVLRSAAKTVTVDRPGQHGGTEDSFQMIADLWSTYLNNTKANFASLAQVEITAVDVAQMMVLLKVARATHGSPEHADHYIDAAGYSSLAAGLAGVKVAPSPAAQMVAKQPPKPEPVTVSTAGLAI